MPAVGGQHLGLCLGLLGVPYKATLLTRILVEAAVDPRCSAKGPGCVGSVERLRLIVLAYENLTSRYS